MVCAVIAGDKLMDFNQLKELGKTLKINKPIKESMRTLLEKLWSLEEGGQTALGPALHLGITVASEVAGEYFLLFFFVVFCSRCDGNGKVLTLHSVRMVLPTKALALWKI